MKMSQSLTNPDVKIQLTQPEDYVLPQLTAKEIKIELKKVVNDTE